MAKATKDGLPRSAFAYAPDADPATWKLPYRSADGSIDTGRLPAAVAALSEGGFRGEKADIPASAMGMVKAKLRAAYRKWKGSDADYPATIAEAAASFEGADIREATVLLDKSAVSATVVMAPNGDTLVIPCWDGQFDQLAKPYEAPTPIAYDPGSYDIGDAASVLQTLARMRAHEKGEPSQQAMIDMAIDGLTSFIRAEATEVKESHALYPVVAAAISEVGKRNSKADQERLQRLHDLLVELGVIEEEKTKGILAVVTPETPLAEAAVEIDAKAKREAISFAEATADGAVLVTLSEAAATFDDATRTVTITPIRPGFGNSRDGFYYPAATLKEATGAGMFDNLKMYRNHPRKSDEKDLPERDVNDWFATTREAAWDETSQRPRVAVKVHDEKDYQRWRDAPEQIAFSVRGGGFARPGKAEGRDAKIVESLAKVRSVDWVTEAGAGGAIDFAESAAANEEFEMDIKALTTEQLREELRIREADEGEGATAVAEPVTAETPDPTPPNPTPEPHPEPPTGEATTTTTTVTSEAPAIESAPAGYVSKEEFEKFKADFEAKAENEKKAKAEADEVREAAAKAVKAEIDASTLPGKVKDTVAAEFAEAGWGNGFTYTDEPAVRGAVQNSLARAAAILQAAGRPVPPVKGLGAAAPEGEGTEQSISESVKAGIEARWGMEPVPDLPKGVYSADELSGQANLVTPAAGDGTQAAEVSEAAATVESSLAARMGI